MVVIVVVVVLAIADRVVEQDSTVWEHRLRTRCQGQGSGVFEDGADRASFGCLALDHDISAAGGCEEPQGAGGTVTIAASGAIRIEVRLSRS